MRGGGDPTGLRPRTARTTPEMFFFFSNRLGCLGSLLLSAVITLAVFAVLRLMT